MKINYYLNFKEENRISMNQYANRLIKSFMDEGHFYYKNKRIEYAWIVGGIFYIIVSFYVYSL